MITVGMGRPFLVAGGMLWATLAIAGLAALARYSSAAGVVVPAPETWPQGSRVERNPATATLVMLAHPRCACTGASIGELDRILAHSGGLLTAYVLVLEPAGSGQDWARTSVIGRAAAIPGVHVVRDPDGAEASRFGARTSGDTLLYDRQGRLLFRGGITPGRGHAGDSAGAAAIAALVSGGESSLRETPVFGCSLFEPTGVIRRRESR